MPWLAQSWKQTNPTTYVYNIRHGVKFSDGTPLTAADVAFSLNYYRHPGSLDAYNFPTTLKSITATGPETLTVTLTKPDAAWAVVPAGDNSGDLREEVSRPTSRPSAARHRRRRYRAVGVPELQRHVKRRTEGEPALLGRKGQHQEGLGAVLLQRDQRSPAFRQGAIDLAFPIDNKAFASTGGVKLTTVPSYAVQGCFFMNVLQKPCNNIHVRRAVAYALNRTALISAWGGYATPVYQFLTAGLLENIDPSAGGRRAQVGPDLPVQPGQGQGRDGAVTVSARRERDNQRRESGSYPNVSQAIAAELAKIGIHLKLQVMTIDQQPPTRRRLTARASSLTSRTAAPCPRPGRGLRFPDGQRQHQRRQLEHDELGSSLHGQADRRGLRHHRQRQAPEDLPADRHRVRAGPGSSRSSTRMRRSRSAAHTPGLLSMATGMTSVPRPLGSSRSKEELIEASPTTRR